MTLLLATLVPKMYALPLAAVLMVLVGLHMSLMREYMPDSARKRIRLATGWVALLAIPLLAMGFSVIDPEVSPTSWILVWLLAMALVAIIVALAMLDILNTIRLSRRSREELRKSLREAIDAAKAARDARSAEQSGSEA